MRYRILITGFLIILTSRAFSAVPQLINYQGHLRESGVSVTGNRDISFSLYDSLSAGVLICESGTQTITAEHGLFSYKIGSAGCDLSSVDLSSPVYLELTVEGITLSPREQITGAAYSVDTLAANVEITPAGNISSTDVQSAIEELDSEKMNLSGGALSGDLSTTGSIAASGTITAASFSGDGSALTGISASATNAETLDGLDSTAFATASHGHTGYMPAGTDDWVDSAGDLMTGDMILNADLLLSGDITASTGTVTAQSFIGDGSALTGIVAVATSTDADMLDGMDSTEFATAAHAHSAYMSAGTDNWVDSAGDLITGDIHLDSDMFVSGGITASTGTITAGAFSGDGSALTGIIAATATTATTATTADSADTLDGLDSTAFATTSHSHSGYMAAGTDNWADSTGDLITGDLHLDADLLVSGDITASTGTITAMTFIGDGSSLTGIAAAATDADTLDGLDSTAFVLKSGDLVTGELNLDADLNVSGDITASTGTITAGAFSGDGSLITGIVAATATTATTADIADTLDGFDSTAFVLKSGDLVSGNLNVNANVLVSGDMTASTGTITAMTFIGDGAGLTGITAATAATATVADTLDGLDSTAFVLRGGDLITGDLHVNADINVSKDINAASATVTALAYEGDGSALTGITVADANTLDGIDSTAFLRKSGGTMTGAINMGGQAITSIDWSLSDIGTGSELDADTIDGINSTAFLAAGGDTMSGDLDMGNNAITNIEWLLSDNGTGSNLDADTIDGINSTAFLAAGGDTMSGILDMGNNAITNIEWILSDDGAGSDLDADLLDGLSSASFLAVAGDTMSGTLDMGNNAITGIEWILSDDGAGSDLDADLLDGINSTAFLAAGGDSMTGDLDMGNNAITNIEWILSDDGSGSDLDADLIDGINSTAFLQKAGGTMSGDLDMGNYAITNIEWTISDNGSGSLLDADLIDGLNSTVFLQKSGGTMTGALNMNSYAITGIDWTGSTDGAGSMLDADYLDGLNSAVFLQKSGGTMSGVLDMGGLGISNIDWSASTDGSGSGLDADYLDGLNSAVFLQKSGGTMSGVLDMGGLGISNIDWSASTDGSGSGLDADTIDGTDSTAFSVTSHTHATYVLKAGDTMSGGLSVTGAVTATSFSGDGSSLTNVTGTDNTKVAKTGDTISGNLGISQGAATATLIVKQTGNADSAGEFSITSGTSNMDALYATTNGSGRAAYILNTGTGAGGSFTIQNAANTANALTLGTNGPGVLLGGDHTGSGGHLVLLQGGGSEMFAVDTNGNVFASGTISAEGDISSSGTVLGSCPAGMTDTGDFCVDSTPRAVDNLVNAIVDCQNDTPSSHLCTPSEWIAACEADSFTYSANSEHWIDQVSAPGQAITSETDSNTCSSNTNYIWTAYGHGNDRNYLCCFSK